MLKKDWLKKFTKITSTKGTDSLKMEITPYRDWRIIVIIFSVGLITSFWFNIYMSLEINKENFFFADNKPTGATKLNEDGLSKIVTGINEKATRFENVVKDGVGAVDPSL